MKKILSIILVIIIAFSFAACGKKNTEDAVNTETENNQVVDNNTEEKEDEKDADENSEKENEKEDEKVNSNDQKEENKPQVKPETKPETAPEAKPENKPQAKPETTPETKPEVKPETKPEEKPQTNQSVGSILLADFKAKAGSSSSALSIAEALLSNSVIAFSGGAMAVEPGFLTGFDNTEIKGFKEGAMFAPMIGTIPFVGYVFTLDDSTNAADFISTLKAAANLRWNICTSADEMVTGSAGNKVFFVMCPKSFDQE